jgi:hypothetical protein
MLRVALLCCAVTASLTVASAQATVHVNPPRAESTKALQEQTAAAAIRNYVEAWGGFRSAFEQNRVDLLNRDFVGVAKEKLSETLGQQAKAGIRTSYQDRAHNIQVVFYSPDGLSLELTDEAEYDVQLIVKNQPERTQHVRAHYIAVMTPAETKWQVRVFQAVPDERFSHLN